MSLLNYKELFEPYTADGHTFEAAMKYWSIIASKNKITTDVMELAINEVFLGIANGKEYSKTKCSCGCGIDKGATDLIHTVGKRMREIDKDVTVQVGKVLRGRYDALIQTQMKKISKTNKEYIKMNQPPITQRSPVLRGSLKLWRLIFSR